MPRNDMKLENLFVTGLVDFDRVLWGDVEIEFAFFPADRTMWRGILANS
jgi:hypothetical protein